MERKKRVWVAERGGRRSGISSTRTEHGSHMSAHSHSSESRMEGPFFHMVAREVGLEDGGGGGERREGEHDA